MKKMQTIRFVAASLIIGVAASSITPVAAHNASVGMASYYKSGKFTANGERFNPQGLTAAHRTLKFGTKIRVTLLKTGRSVVVRVNDRGPFIKGRSIDLSLGAAKVIGLHRYGVSKVKMEILK